MLEARIRDERVEATEALERHLDGRLVAVPGRQVGSERLARAVGIGFEVDRQHLPAVGDETPGNGTADPARGPCDERGFAHGQRYGPPRT